MEPLKNMVNKQTTENMAMVFKANYKKFDTKGL